MLYWFARMFFKLYFLIYHRVRVEGLPQLERFIASSGGPVVLAANHASYLDPPAIGMAFPGKMRFVAWDGLFKVPIFSSMIAALGAVPVSQEDKRSAAGLLLKVIGFIEGGFNVLIFPEGRRSPDGRLLPIEGGVALIALKTGAPVVPVWLEGTWDALPMHLTLPRPRKVTIRFGTPIIPGETAPGAPEKERRKLLLDRLLASLEKLRDESGKSRASS
ncbi:MAG: 1-acyl-sn-glycerol-3-phosphate acyltransferase [Synergistaceae bacterium]|jgi:1-acyl-sn-glycerol-3-phosphate acyltransferase|nr:1-acyl-sn-glycerol-3-phosphate acyltransferase [Synergistaceae bacterium]